MENGSIVAALAAMGFVMVGLFQFFKGYIASNNKDYLDLRSKYEASQQKVIELETSKLHWENRARVATASNRRLRKELSKCHETLNAYLLKTQPITNEVLSRLDVDDTFVPSISGGQTENKP